MKRGHFGGLLAGLTLAGAGLFASSAGAQEAALPPVTIASQGVFYAGGAYTQSRTARSPPARCSCSTRSPRRRSTPTRSS